jgi:hypothetical protein
MTDGQLRKKILITGATGYIGRRLKTSLLKIKNPALSLRLLVRNRNKVNPQVWQEVEKLSRVIPFIRRYLPRPLPALIQPTTLSTQWAPGRILKNLTG